MRLLPRYIAPFMVVLLATTASTPRAPNQPPTITVVSTIHTHAGCGFRVAAVVWDHDKDDSVSIRVNGLPSFLALDLGAVSPEFTIAAVRGLVPRDHSGKTFDLHWIVEDSRGQAASSSTRLVVEQADIATSDLESRVTRLVRAQYAYGMPTTNPRQMGPDAVPILEKLLRESEEKRSWLQVVTALAFIGLPSSYDSLRSFIWTRFSGPVDAETFRALFRAQATLGAFSGSRPDVIDSLVQSTNPDSWVALPWSYRTKDLGVLMAGRSIYALSTIADGKAVAALERMERNPDPDLVDYLADARERRALVLQHGWITAREMVRASHTD